MALKDVDNDKDEEDEASLVDWTIVVKKEEGDDWETVDNTDYDEIDTEWYPDKGSARQASASIRDYTHKRKVMKVKFSSLD